MTVRQKILIVDDREENLFALEKILLETEVEVVKALGGNEALAATLHHDFALAILDVQMPEMNGFELADHLRGDGKTRSIPIIFLTAAFTNEESAFKGYEAGAVDYIVKPFNPTILKGKVAAFLELARYRSQLEDMVRERTKRLRRLNRILRNVRNVSQLIVRERDESRLIREACKLLVDERGFDGAWISLVDGARHLVDSASEGFADKLSHFDGVFQSEELPNCCKEAVSTGGVVVTPGEQVSCVDCPLGPRDHSGGALVTALEHEGNIHGFIGIAAPAATALDEEEQTIFREVAEDIAYALTNIQTGKEREAAGQALRASEKQFRNMFANHDAIMLLVDPHSGNIVDANLSAQRYYGYDRPQLVGMNIREINALAPEEVAAERQRALRGEQNYFVFPHRLATGEVRTVEVGCSPIEVEGRSLLFSIIHDISERKAAEEALATSERKYRSLVEHLTDLVVRYDMNLCRTYVNPAWEKASGLSYEQVIHSPIDEIRGVRIPIDSDYMKTLRQVMETGCRQEVEFTGKNTRGETLILSFVVAPEYDRQGEMVSLLCVGRDITKRKKAEQDLVKERNFSAFILDSLPGTFYLFDVQGRFKRWNSILEHVSGYSSDEINSMMLLDFIPEDEKAKVQEAVNQVFTTGETYLEAEWLTKSGERLPYYFKAKRIFIEGEPFLMGVGIDLTERKRIKRNLRESEEKYRRIFENSIIGIFQTTPGGRWITANRAVSNLFGYVSPEEMIGEVTDIGSQIYARAEDREEAKRTINELSSLEGYEFEGRRKDGTHVWVSLNAQMVKDEHGEVLYYEGMMEDITDRKRLQQQLLQAQKMESIGTLAGGVAHDFNNILQVALGYSEVVLADERLPELFKSDLQKINESSRRGADLVQRLLTFSRKTEINPQPLNLNHRIKEMMKMIQRTIPKMIEVQFLPDAHLANINADATQIDQILINLAVNARDAMPQGGKLTLKTENIVLDEEYSKANIEASPGSYALLTVTDNGSGMDEETLKHIFEPFYTTKSAGEGTGLGLAMVHGIVKQHGGHIACHSEPNTGTSFRIFIPAKTSDEEGERTKMAPMPRGGTETILLVDDEEHIGELGSRILQKAGYSVITASNGRAALDTYRAKSDQIALVLLDLIMPEMGGAQCLEALISLDPSVKVVIASGYCADGPTEDALYGNAKGFVGKPFNIRQMLKVVREALDEQ